MHVYWNNQKLVDWGGYVSDSSKPFILIIGSFRAEQVTEILDGFLNTVSPSAFYSRFFVYLNSPKLTGKHRTPLECRIPRHK